MFVFQIGIRDLFMLDMKILISLSVIILFNSPNCSAFSYTDDHDVNITYDITSLSKCGVDEDRFRRMLGVSLPECVRECGLRAHCEALSYRRKMHCDLFTTTDFGNLSDGDCVYISSSDKKMEKKPCRPCNHGQTCDTVSHTCIYKECLPKVIDNGKVLGNKNEVGSKIQYKCNHGYENKNGVRNAVCQENGQWNATRDCWQIRNVALMKQTKMSSVRPGTNGTLGVDGNTNPIFGRSSCFHTEKQHDPWWRVDLEAKFRILKVKLFNRLDCCSNRASNLQLLIGVSEQSMVIVGSVPGQIDDIHTFHLPSGTEARYVKVTLKGEEFFHLCEVQVFGF